MSRKKLAWETLEAKLDDIPLHPCKKQNVNDEEIELLTCNPLAENMLSDGTDVPGILRY
jgi:pyruvate formate-lyase activating enzyme-like uncharacterized protein